MKTKILTALLAMLMLFVFAACGDDASTGGGSTKAGSVDRYFWGKWTQMDSGDVYQITDRSVTKNGGSALSVGSASTTSISFGGQTLVQESENVARLGASTLLFRDGGAKRSFSVRLTGFSAASGIMARAGVRAPTIGDNPIGDRPTTRTNVNNPGDSQMITSGSDGLITFTNAVAGDNQIITVGTGGTNQNITVTVKPGFDGQDLGTIPVVENGYSFKVTSTVATSDGGYLYGNNYNTYSVAVNLKNIGNSRCTTSYYEVTPDAGLTVVSGALSGNYSSLEPGTSRDMAFTVRYGMMTEEYKDVKLTIKITDSLTFRTWVDYVVLRFHKRPVPIRISSQNLDGSNTATLKGFIIHPDNRSARFTVPNNGSATVYAPWSAKPYRMVFSGAGANTEMKYSFVVGTSTRDLAGTWPIADISAYELNNTEATRTQIIDAWIAKKAFLSVEDIDFYDINLSAMPDSVPVVPATTIADIPYGATADTQGTTSPTGVVKLTFDGNGHTGGTVPAAVSGSNGWTVTLPAEGTLTKTGASFSGWYSSTTGLVYLVGASYALAESEILCALWKNSYGIAFYDMVSVPSGTFTQESTQDNSVLGSFSHTITSFKIGKYEVTYELWYKVRQWALSNGYQFANLGREGTDGVIGAAPTTAMYMPVISVNWRDAIVWCNAYSQWMGLTPVYWSDSGFITPIVDSRSGIYGSSVNTTAGSFDNPYVNWNANGYRLPSEGEWQYAASYNDGVTWTPCRWASGATALDEIATSIVGWWSVTTSNHTKAVMTKKANQLGIYDMSGNAQEYCFDWLGGMPTVAQIDYRGPASSGSKDRVVRGGGIDNYYPDLRVGYRGRMFPYMNYCGIRLAQKQ